MTASLSIKNLSIYFGETAAVRDISLTVEAGRFMALVGESGSGKSQTALSIGQLQPSKAEVQAEAIAIGDFDLWSASTEQRRKALGEEIAYIFQEPMTALNPVLAIKTQMREIAQAHRSMATEAIDQLCLSWLSRVQVPDAERVFSAYPHELSGGLRQRVMIAMALLLDPQVLIADEPTTALDVTIQREIMDLLRHLQEETGITVLFITHDLDVVEAYADDIAVMYAGAIVEQGPANQVLSAPQHPYTHGLLACTPRNQTYDNIRFIPGKVEPALRDSCGCQFRARCPLNDDATCVTQTPALTNLVACHHPLTDQDAINWRAQ